MATKQRKQNVVQPENGPSEVKAKTNISKRQITSFKVYDSSPGVNSKRGLVARTSGTVVNRNNRVQARSYHAHAPNPTTIIISSDVSLSKPVGFSLNGTKNIKGTVQQDTNLAYQSSNKNSCKIITSSDTCYNSGHFGCCSDSGTSIKKSVVGSKGMLDSKKYRNSNCCVKSQNEKLCDKQSIKNIEALTKSASEVTTNRKHKNEICANVNPLCIESSDTPKNCVSGCHKQIHINHGHGIVQSSSDYIVQRKSKNQRNSNCFTRNNT